MRLSPEDGQAIIEFALVLPALLAVGLAIVIVSDVGVARLALQHAASEGARAGALTNDDEIVRDTVAATVSPLSPERIRTAIAPPESEPPRDGDPRGSLLTVRAEYDVTLPLAFVGLTQVTVVSSATRRIEWTP